MDTCVKCKLFLNDWFTQPFSPRNLLYNDIHHKRLLKVLPSISAIFIHLIKDLTYYDLNGIFTTIEGILIHASTDILFEPKHVVESTLLKISWNCMAEHYLGKAPNEIGYIQDILKDAFVCKNGNENELIGYYLTSMITNLKEVHSCHVSPPIQKDTSYD
jgi:hypothetical protein